jgi:hypothetical protein
MSIRRVAAFRSAAVPPLNKSARLSYIQAEGPCRGSGINKGGRGSKDLTTMRNTLALAALSLTLAGAAMAQDRSVQIVNDSGFTITSFYASTLGAADWQEDVLGGQAVATGATLTVNFDDGSGDCAYSFRAVFDDGDEAVGEIDVCAGNSIVIN